MFPSKHYRVDEISTLLLNGAFLEIEEAAVAGGRGVIRKGG